MCLHFCTFIKLKINSLFSVISFLLLNFLFLFSYLFAGFTPQCTAKTKKQNTEKEREYIKLLHKTLHKQPNHQKASHHHNQRYLSLFLFSIFFLLLVSANFLIISVDVPCPFLHFNCFYILNNSDFGRRCQFQCFASSFDVSK